MNRKYLSSFLIGAGVFSSALGNVAFANPLSDEEWVRYEEKLNKAHKIESEESFVQRFFSVFVWWNYYKDCKVKEYTDKNIAVSRKILDVFKDTFGLEALDDCRLTYGDNKNVTCNYVNDYDQIFSLQKERKLLNALRKLFGNKEKLNKYVLFCEDSSKAFLKQGGVFGKLEGLLDDALKIYDKREYYVNSADSEKIYIDRKFWEKLKNQSSFLKYTTSNIAIAKKILGVLKNDFNIGEGADWYLCQEGAKSSRSPGVVYRDPALCAEEYLVCCIGTLFGSLNDLINNKGYKPPEKIEKGGIENFRKKIKELKELMSIAVNRAKERCSLNKKKHIGDCVSSIWRSWKDCVEGDSLKRKDNITFFSELYEQKCLGSALQHNIGGQIVGK